MVKKLTPMMEQFYRMKQEYADCILFFRLGDFYEMFGDDAIECAQILDITLTARSKGEDALPMCGVPYHSAEGYILKLTHAGKKVAICEQISDPKLPGIVERDVVRVITPGTNLNEAYLEAKVHNHVLAIVNEDECFGLAYADISTGEIYLNLINNDALANLLEQIRPSEIIANATLVEDPQIYRLTKELNILVSKRKPVSSPIDLLKGFLKTDRLEGFDLDHQKDGLLIQAAANLFSYFKETQKRDLPHLSRLRKIQNDDFLLLDATTIQNLELFYTQKEHSKKGSLFNVINQTVTRSGARMLARWLIQPLRNLDQIKERQTHVNNFVNNNANSITLREVIKTVPDIQRLISRISLNQGSPRDIAALRNALVLLPVVRNQLTSFSSPTNKVANNLPLATELKDLLVRAIDENPPHLLSELGIIKDGYNTEIDELRSLHENAENVLANFLDREKVATGIQNLKIGSNKIVGFYLEVSKGKLDLVPNHYIAKQTLTNYNRYITPELKEYEEKILHAEHKLHQLETKICQEIFREIINHNETLNCIAEIISEIDCWLSMANLAIVNRYVLPEVSPENQLKITAGRHPVVEKLIETGQFVANDTVFTEQERVVVLTGPNMGGKSTYLRQTALITLLAHMGSYVPADQAIIPLTDRIFTRVGASDNLGKGQSTFMVEMQELAVILNQATDRSLLIIDEIGRGTSTYDGVSIAWATLEYIHNEIQANTLFATHYHELVDVAEKMPHATNYSMAVYEKENEVIFLHRVQQGGMNDSYGIEVAKRAGIPHSVTDNALLKLHTLENGHLTDRIQQSLNNNNTDPNQLNIFTPITHKESPIINHIRQIDVNELTPLAALQLLAEWQKKC